MEEISNHNKAILLWGPVKGRIIRGEWYKNNKLSRYPIWTKKKERANNENTDVTVENLYASISLKTYTIV